MQVFSKCQYPLKRAGLAINHLKGNVPGAGINSKYSVGKVLPGNRVSLAKLSSLSSLVCITAKIELFSFPPPLSKQFVGFCSSSDPAILCLKEDN